MHSDHLPENPSPATIPELISIDFQKLTKKLTDREETLKNKNKELQKEKDLIFKENKKLNGLLKKFENEVKVRALENGKMEDELKKKGNEIDEMKKKVKVCEKRFLDLGVRVLSLEKLGKELIGSQKFSCSGGLDNKKNGVAAESSRQHISSEKGDSKKRTEAMFPEIFEIDDESDDDDDVKNISALKRKRLSNQIKREEDSDDDFVVRIKKVKGVCNDDFVGNITTGSQPKTSHTASPFLDSSDSGSGSKHELLEEAYNSSSAKMKKQNWIGFKSLLNTTRPSSSKYTNLTLSSLCQQVRKRSDD